MFQMLQGISRSEQAALLPSHHHQHHHHHLGPGGVWPPNSVHDDLSHKGKFY